MKHLIHLLVWMGILLPSFTIAQSSIKLKKQPTKFLYFQLNSHYGQFDIGETRYRGLANYGSSNQFAVQFLSKNKKRLQRGFTDRLERGNFFARVSVQAKSSFVGEQEQIRLQLNAEAWIGILSKWDRTSIKVGLRNLPYGHNPRIDADFAFLSPLVKKDLGFSKDLGIFTKVALNKHFDVETALTAGGYLSRPILTTKVINQSIDNADFLTLNNYDYQGTWLLTNRIGTPTFKNLEYGVYTSLGHIYSPLVANEFGMTARVGADVIYKFKDMIKFGNHISYGNFKSENAIYGMRSISMQNTLDCTVFGILNMSISHEWQRFQHMDTAMGAQRIFSASTMLVFTPDMKFKFNMYRSYDLSSGMQTNGMFGQLILGFGKRA